MTVFIGAVLLLSLTANAALGIAVAYLAARRPGDHRPPGRKEPHRVDPSRPHRHTATTVMPAVKEPAVSGEVLGRGTPRAPDPARFTPGVVESPYVRWRQP